MESRVRAVASSPSHTFSKPVRERIVLVARLGVEGDAHLGTTVKHRSRVARDPGARNLRQVHLLGAELHEELAALGFEVRPGDLGENVTTCGLDLLSLPPGTRLRLGDTAVVEIAGLRNPCRQLDRFRPGLMEAVLARDDHGKIVRKAGVMATVAAGGAVEPGDPIVVELPPGPPLALRVV
jgi:MOSC domain-containing protein YiiM